MSFAFHDFLSSEYSLKMWAEDGQKCGWEVPGFLPGTDKQQQTAFFRGWIKAPLEERRSPPVSWGGKKEGKKTGRGQQQRLMKTLQKCLISWPQLSSQNASTVTQLKILKKNSELTLKVHTSQLHHLCPLLKRSGCILVVHLVVNFNCLPFKCKGVRCIFLSKKVLVFLCKKWEHKCVLPATLTCASPIWIMLKYHENVLWERTHDNPNCF